MLKDYPFDVPTQLYHCWEVIFEVDMTSFDIGSELICDIDDAFDDVNENPDDHCWEVGFKINMLVLDVDIAMDVNEEHI